MISNELYPYIDYHILEAAQYLKQEILNKEATIIYDLFNNLKLEFDSLKDYNINIAFPTILKTAEMNKTQEASINELELCTLRKEKAMFQLIADIKHETELLNLQGNHILLRLIEAFKIQFLNSKKEWNKILLELSKSA